MSQNLHIRTDYYIYNITLWCWLNKYEIEYNKFSFLKNGLYLDDNDIIIKKAAHYDQWKKNYSHLAMLH